MNILSNRQNEVVNLVTKGFSNKEVASQLNITEKTVKFHLTGIYKILQVKNRTQLTLKILQGTATIGHSHLPEFYQGIK